MTGHPSPPTTLQAIRSTMGLTQAQVAERMGVSVSWVSRLERSADPRVSTLVRYLAAVDGYLLIEGWPSGPTLMPVLFEDLRFRGADAMTGPVRLADELDDLVARVVLADGGDIDPTEVWTLIARWALARATRQDTDPDAA